MEILTNHNACPWMFFVLMIPKDDRFAYHVNTVYT